MKDKIEQMYIQALIDDLAPNVFADQVLRLLGVGTRTFLFSGIANGVKFVINVQAPNRESAIAYFEDEHPKLEWRTTTEITNIS